MANEVDLFKIFINYYGSLGEKNLTMDLDIEKDNFIEGELEKILKNEGKFKKKNTFFGNQGFNSVGKFLSENQICYTNNEKPEELREAFKKNNDLKNIYLYLTAYFNSYNSQKILSLDLTPEEKREKRLGLLIQVKKI